MVSISIEPFEPLVEKAIALIEEKESGYFSKVNKIVVDSRDLGHFGRVESDKEDTIFISTGRVRNALGHDSEEAQVLEVALTLAHEVGHLKANFRGGEGPAELEEKRILDLLKTNSVANANLNNGDFEFSKVDSIPLFVNRKVAFSRKNKYQDFFMMHLKKTALSVSTLSEDDFDQLIEYLLPFNNGSIKKSLLSIKKEDANVFKKILEEIHNKELNSSSVFESTDTNGPFSVPVGENLSTTVQSYENSY